MVQDAGRWSVRRLDRRSDVAAMDCGEDAWGQSVTEFLVEDTFERQELLLNRTTLFYYDDILIGYVTLASALLEVRQAARVAQQPGISEIGREIVPSVLIARFGVHKDHQRRGYGRRMFDWVLAEVFQGSVGTRLLILHVDKENAGGRSFWKECGFRGGAVRKSILMWLDLYPHRPTDGLEKREGGDGDPLR